MFDVDFYRFPDGTAPVEQFLDSLPVKMRTKAMYSLLLLERFGNRLREPYSKEIDQGIFELGIQFANDITRIFYFFYVGNKIVLTNGFVKKTQKTPKSEIQLAIRCKKDYERRNCHE